MFFYNNSCPDLGSKTIQWIGGKSPWEWFSVLIKQLMGQWYTNLYFLDDTASPSVSIDSAFVTMGFSYLFSDNIKSISKKNGHWR